MTRVASIFAWTFLVLLLVLAIVRSLTIAYADILFREGTVQSLAKATRVLPSKAVYHLRYAQALEQATPGAPNIDEELRTAVSLNGRNTEALITWSLRDEMAGDSQSAERLLLRAVDVDHQFKPVWALANFYFRAGDVEKFWPQARKALKLIGDTGLAEGQYDPGPIFNLCWQLPASGLDILNHAIPGSRIIQMRYLSYLITASKLKDAGDLSDRLLPAVYEGEVPIWTSYVDVLINSGDIGRAQNVWAELLGSKLLKYRAPDPAHGDCVTNGDFAQSIFPHGFDWRLATPLAIQFTQTRQPTGLLLEFGGQQPEHSVVMAQTVPVLAGHSYRFEVTYGTPVEGCKSCFHWRLRDHRTNRPVGPGGDAGVSVSAETTMLDVAVPNGVGALDLVFAYDRALGERQFEGAVEISQVQLVAR